MLFVSSLGNYRVGVIAYQMRDQKIRVALDGENVSMIFVLVFFEDPENGIVYEFILYKMLEGVVLLLEEKRRQIQAKKVTFARDPLVKLVSVYDYAVAFFCGYYPLAAPDGKIAATKKQYLRLLVPVKIEVIGQGVIFNEMNRKSVLRDFFV